MDPCCGQAGSEKRASRDLTCMFFCSPTQLSLDTALKLQIPEEHDEGQQMRSYSLEDLRELQNKLMLMSGKGDQGQNEVDRFAEVHRDFPFNLIDHSHLSCPAS